MSIRYLAVLALYASLLTITNASANGRFADTSSAGVFNSMQAAQERAEKRRAQIYKSVQDLGQYGADAGIAYSAADWAALVNSELTYSDPAISWERIELMRKAQNARAAQVTARNSTTRKAEPIRSTRNDASEPNIP